MSAYTECTITPAQEKLWEQTRATLMWRCPAFSHIFYKLLAHGNSQHVAFFTTDVPIAATDGERLLINPEPFFALKLDQRLFVVAHEIMHCIWNHMGLIHGFKTRGTVKFPDGSSLPYQHDLMNIAMDLVINDALIESKVGAFKEGWMHDQSIATAKDSVIDAYRKVFKEAEKNGGKGEGGGSGVKGQGFDEHLAPGAAQGKDPTQAVADRNDAQWATEIQAAAAVARVQGKLPAGLERIFGEILNPQVDWREHIQALFARKVGSGSYNFRKPDRRLIVRDIYAPGRSGFGCGTIVVAVDTSGSIGPKELDMFFAEMSGILEDCKPRQIMIMWCDARVHRVDQVEEASDLNTVRAKKAPGGGGTSFVPVFDKIAELGVEPDALVYLTDLYGDFPAQAPSYTTIWGSISKGVPVPFGDLVEVPVQAKER